MGQHEKPRVEVADVNTLNGAAVNGLANGKEKTYLITPAQTPRSLREALREARANSTVSTESGTTSEEDYDELTSSPEAVVVRRRKTAAQAPSKLANTNSSTPASTRPMEDGSHDDDPNSRSSTSSPELVKITRRTTIIPRDDPELAEAVRNGLRRVEDPSPRRGKFGDLVFTRKFSTFDRQNEQAANSPFHGFFTLFWIAVALFMVKIAARNWATYGSPLGENAIMQLMFRRDLLVLLLADGAMCGLTGVSWLLQKAIFAGYIDWDREGWIIQNVWQSLYIGGVIGLTLIRDWPWTHTVFFVMHGLVMLMKQHSYAFYNGYLSSAYKKRAHLLVKLKQLEDVSPTQAPSATGPPVASLSTAHLNHLPTGHEWKERRASMSYEKAIPDTDKIAAAIESGQPLDGEQVHVFERIIKWEIDALTDELKGKSTSMARAYPNNLTLRNHSEFVVLPTLVYELEYPRSESVNWSYAAEKFVACFGIIGIMIMVSQAFIYPVVVETVAWKDAGMPLGERFAHFPWMLGELIFPFMMEYLMAWYLIWEIILNFIAEVTYFADRSFYDAWWNSVSWDQFARDWNRPVHNFLLRHVYHSSISAMRVNKYTATLITFFLSACVHELVMWCIFKKLRGYLLILQMFQLPLVRLSRTKWLRNRQTLGNVIFWLGIFTGPSLLCSLYLIL